MFKTLEDSKDHLAKAMWHELTITNGMEYCNPYFFDIIKQPVFFLLFFFSGSQKVMRRSQHARKETEFLRLKRTRLGLDDFESLKVIGRGAFGEVRILP